MPLILRLSIKRKFSIVFFKSTEKNEKISVEKKLQEDKKRKFVYFIVRRFIFLKKIQFFRNKGEEKRVSISMAKSENQIKCI